MITNDAYRPYIYIFLLWKNFVQDFVMIKWNLGMSLCIALAIEGAWSEISDSSSLTKGLAMGPCPNEVSRFSAHDPLCSRSNLSRDPRYSLTLSVYWPSLVPIHYVCKTLSLSISSLSLELKQHKELQNVDNNVANFYQHVTNEIF